MNPIRVLIIEDHQELAEGIAELLRFQGFETVVALNGEDGVRLANDFSADAVLLDIDLPDMTGHEVLQKLRATVETTAVIFHTGSERATGEHYGADAFLTYPVATEQLVSVIKGSVARRQSDMRKA
jgi:two-component system OmpR family response regulator